MRVVSLLPAATETVAALGAGGYLVGVSHECDYPPEVRALPRVTRTRIDSTRASGDIDRAVTEAQRAGTSAIDVDVELVARLRPDVIIGQALCPVCAVGAGDLERLRSEEHTSELQSLAYLVCRLLLEKKKKKNRNVTRTSAT